MRVHLWAKEAVETAAPPRTLITNLDLGAALGSMANRAQHTEAEETLQEKLAEFTSLVARLKRYALLNEEVYVVGTPGMALLGDDDSFSRSTAGGGPSLAASASPPRRTTMMKESAGLDESRSLLADLLCALRACMTAVVEAVNECTTEQAGDNYVNLNLPAMRRAFPPINAGVSADEEGFAEYSAQRHTAILCSLVEQVACFIPLPFAHDPLLLKWFDEHSELWQTTVAMQAVKASRLVQHTITDRKRMENAQLTLQAALKTSGADAPRVLLHDPVWDAFPPHTIGAPEPSSTEIPAPVPAPVPSHSAFSSHMGAPSAASSRPLSSSSAGRLPRSATGTPNGSRRGVLPSPSAPSLPAPGASAANGGMMRPGSKAGVRDELLPLPSTSPPRPGSAGGVAAGGVAAGGVDQRQRPSSSALSRASRASRVTSAFRSASSLPPTSASLVAPSPSNLAPDTERPPDPKEEARMRAEARARALWSGMELLIYGQAGCYRRAIHRMFQKIEEDERNRKLAAHAYSVIAVGGVLDEETLINLAVRTLQRNWRKKRMAQQEAVHRKAEHSATIAILGVHQNSNAARQHHNLSRRRGREHLALIEKVAAHRILSFFRSPQYRYNSRLRFRSCILMQTRVRRFLAHRRVKRRVLNARTEETQAILSTVSVKGAFKHARVIQQQYQSHRHTTKAKFEAFAAQAVAFPSALQAAISTSAGGVAIVAAATVAENHAKMIIRDMAISRGTVPGASAGSSRPDPLTPAVLMATEKKLRAALLDAVRATQSKLAPAAPASVTAWATAVEARAQLEGALTTLQALERAWPVHFALLGQVSLLRQQLRAPPPPPARNAVADAPEVVAVLEEVTKFAHALGSSAVCDSFQSMRYTELLQRLALQRQEALKISLRLEFCHQLKGMRKRHTLIRIAQREAAALARFVPIAVHRAAVLMTLRCDDWRSADGSSPKLEGRLAHVFCDEVRDWYGVPHSLDLAAHVVSSEGNKLLVRLEVFEKRAERGGAHSSSSSHLPGGKTPIPPSTTVMALTNVVLDRIADTPANVEKGRHPELAELLGCTYIGIEVHEKFDAHTEVFPEPTLAARVASARKDFARAQKELDAMGAATRTQKWANIRKWHFIEGAVSWLKGDTTAELGNALSEGVEIQLPTAKHALEAKVASRMRWEAVKSQIKVKQEQNAAEQQKETKKGIVAKQQEAAATELLAAMLLEASYAALPDLPWRGEGQIDIRWNLGLLASKGGGSAKKEEGGSILDDPTIEFEMLPTAAALAKRPEEGSWSPPLSPSRKSPSPSPSDGASPQAARAAAKPAPDPTPEDEHLQICLALSARPATGGQELGRRSQPNGKQSKLCYYCAGGRGGSHHPVSAEHQMSTCQLRTLHGEREFPPQALVRVQGALAEEEAVLNRAITDQAAGSIEAKLSRKGSYQLGGVSSCVVSARQRHLPWRQTVTQGEDYQPKPPPKWEDPKTRRGCFLTHMLVRMRETRAFWETILVQAIARDARVSGYARLSDFKGLAVLQMMPPPPTERTVDPLADETTRQARAELEDDWLGAGARGASALVEESPLKRAGTMCVDTISFASAPAHAPMVRANTMKPMSQHAARGRPGSPGRPPSAGGGLRAITGAVMAPNDIEGQLRIASTAANSSAKSAPSFDRWTTPARVLDAADDLGLLFGMIGSIQGLGGPPPGGTTQASPYRALWIAAEYALAPLPALWSAKLVPDEDSAGQALKLVYEKAEQGQIVRRDVHPLKEAYRSTAARFIPHCPHLSLKQAPHCAYMLFSIDGLPRCVDMRHAAKKRYQLKRQPAPVARRNSVNSSKLQSSLQRESERQRRTSQQTSIFEVKRAEATSEAAGLSVCTFPTLKASAYSFAPQPQIEVMAAKLAQLSRAAIEHAAGERFEARQKANRLDAEQKAKEWLASAKLVNVKFRISSQGVRCYVGLAQSRMSREERELKEWLESAEAKAEEEALQRSVCLFEEVDALRMQFDAQRAMSLKAAPRSLEEVMVMAAYLGLPFGGAVGVEHLWIADAALCPQLPIGWVEHRDEEADGTPYYQNVWNDEMMWEHPQVSALRGTVEAINNAEAAKAKATAAARAAAPQPAPAKAPAAAPAK